MQPPAPGSSASYLWATAYRVVVNKQTEYIFRNKVKASSGEGWVPALPKGRQYPPPSRPILALSLP